MPYVLMCIAGCSLIVAVWIPWRRRFPLMLLRAMMTLLLVIVTVLGIEVLRELRGLNAIGNTTADGFSRFLAH